ncbi:aldehyde dehydrogenase family protein [Gordonia crocea]|uniref:Aldehyde dehydrogenase n=1 Tax=Gordonia crocea TaxID=589162 RepID=A0A7M3SUB6_9ACTN|nr:aldehyde dehydrogenase family protein [Gordonia crocea]GED96240.1 aldehyde dehydrogenase [Gordonia crocea]
MTATRVPPVTGTFPVVDPATGEPFADAPDAGLAELDAAVVAADAAFAAWSRDDDARREALRGAGAALMAAAADLAPTLSREQGNPLHEAALEMQTGGYWLMYFADLDDPVEVVADDDYSRIEVVRRPLGPVAAITPWNFPITLALWKIAPALRAGNPVIVKPSPYTPLSTLAVVDLLAPHFPAGVLQAITGVDPLGARLVEHPLIRKVSFTGSTATGKRVAASAATDLKRVTLELGGNDAAIVLPDAPIAKTAPLVFHSAMANNGQICMAVKRAYVPESMYDDFVDAVAATAAAVVLGPGDRPGVTHGPINNRMQFERVGGLVDDAIARGARVVTGGRRHGDHGYFYEPTVLAGLSDGVRVVDEEQFGPVLPIIAYRDVDDAIARANASHYGLGSSLWTEDVDAARTLAPRLDAGTTWINTHLLVTPAQPFGGAKSSGIGVEGGHWGLHSFSEPHTIHTAK